MSKLLRSYIRFTLCCANLSQTITFLNQVRLLKLTDKRLIALNLAAEALGIDSELYLFKQFSHQPKLMVELSVYSRRSFSKARR